MTTPYREGTNVPRPWIEIDVSWAKVGTVAAAILLSTIFVTTFRYCERQPSELEEVQADAVTYAHRLYPGQPIRLACLVMNNGAGPDHCTLILGETRILLDCVAGRGCEERR